MVLIWQENTTRKEMQNYRKQIHVCLTVTMHGASDWTIFRLTIRGKNVSVRAQSVEPYNALFGICSLMHFFEVGSYGFENTGWISFDRFAKRKPDETHPASSHSVPSYSRRWFWVPLSMMMGHKNCEVIPPVSCSVCDFYVLLAEPAGFASQSNFMQTINFVCVQLAKFYVL